MEGIDLSFAPRKCKKLLSDFSSNKISISELEIECAYWLLSDECFRELKPKPLPAPIPELLADYYSMPPERKRRIDEDQNFWKRHDISTYLNMKLNVQSINKTNKLRLLEAKKLIPKEDIISQTKINERLEEYESIR